MEGFLIALCALEAVMIAALMFCIGSHRMEAMSMRMLLQDERAKYLRLVKKLKDSSNAKDKTD